MSVITTGNSFSTGDQATAATLNASVNAATFAAGSVDDSTTQLSGGAIIVKDLGITPSKLSATTGTGSVVRATAPTVTAITVSGAVTSATLTTTGDISIGDNFTSSSLNIGSNGSYLGRRSSDGSTLLNAFQTEMVFMQGGNVAARYDSSANFYVGNSIVAAGTSAANVLVIANGTAPSSQPAGIGQLYVESGALKFRGSGGTVTTIANA